MTKREAAERMDWQELKIDDLPSDILVGDYETQSKYHLLSTWPEWGPDFATDMHQTIKNLAKGFEIRYRPRQPEKKEVSHEEIMTLWWKDGEYWKRVFKFCKGQYLLAGTGNWLGKSWFTDRASATIPPEAEC